MQFEDSCICEGVALHFAEMDAPTLPVYDSSIMHHGYGGELEEAMRRASYDRFGGDTRTLREMREEYKADESPPTSIGLDEVLELEKEYSRWQARICA